MILIYSIKSDETTNKVIDWLDFFNEKWRRINLLHFGDNTNFTINFSNNKKVLSIENDFQNINIKKVKSVWLRRYSYYSPFNYSNDIDLDSLRYIRNNIEEEKTSVWELLNRNLFKREKWLNHFESIKISKMKQLELAINLKINIPHTIITTQKSDLIKFKKNHINIVIKPIETFGSHIINGNSYTPLTRMVSDDFIDSLDDTFFPILCQKYIEKDYEIRSFYLNGSFYSMAMFTQKSEKTKIDSRNHDEQNPTRNVPYQLSSALEEKLKYFMNLQNLNCGSFDFIRSNDNKLYFLEVNPVGQFGNVSYCCNYSLEKKIAEFLMSTNE